MRGVFHGISGHVRIGGIVCHGGVLMYWYVHGFEELDVEDNEPSR
jgi:hypothetical protein